MQGRTTFELPNSIVQNGFLVLFTSTPQLGRNTEREWMTWSCVILTCLTREERFVVQMKCPGGLKSSVPPIGLANTIQTLGDVFGTM